MTELSWAEIVRQVHKRAKYCCEYCQTAQRVIGQAMHVEHIVPGNGDVLENLCLSCPSCNLSKAKATEAKDRESGEIVPLFNARSQAWNEHFEWIEDGTIVKGKTPIGRATIIRLKMNQLRIVEARQIWVDTKVHPQNKPCLRIIPTYDGIAKVVSCVSRARLCRSLSTFITWQTSV